MHISITLDNQLASDARRHCNISDAETSPNSDRPMLFCGRPNLPNNESLLELSN